MKIRIGSRKSDLAQIQSRIVAAQLLEVQPELDIEYVFKDVGVDLNLNISLVEAESKGLFTKDLSQDLINGKIDIVVHSWKDLPTSGPLETTVAATLEREDPRDVVFIKSQCLENSTLSFLSSSPRREHNLGGFLQKHIFPHQKLKFLAVRGNLPTRMRKFLESPDEALVLALAAVKRLLAFGNEESKQVLREVLAQTKVIVVPVTDNPPAPAQGALAIEVRKDRTDLVELLSRINHTTSFEDVICERERLKDFGGGCHLALGIYQRSTKDGTLKVERGLSPDKSELSLTEWINEKAIPNFAPEKFLNASSLKIFDRKEIAVTETCKSERHLYFVSKADALPASWARSEDVFWVAGLESWKKLRQKGLWVSGSQEALGESFLDIPTELWPDLKLLKLAHQDAPRLEGEASFCATYELVRNSVALPDLSPYEAFYWPSGSLFKACLLEQPGILKKLHFCGLGNTFLELQKHIPAERLFTVLKAEDCLP